MCRKWHCKHSTGRVWSHTVKMENSTHIMSLHASLELKHLTCFDRYLLSSLWFLSTCLDMVPSDDRLNSKFSIVSFVASEGANYNEDELTRSRMTYSGLLLLNQTVRFIPRLPVWGRTTTHKHVPVTGVKILSTCEWKSNPSGSDYFPSPHRGASPSDDATGESLRRHSAILCETSYLSSSEVTYTLLFGAFTCAGWLWYSMNHKKRP